MNTCVQFKNGRRLIYNIPDIFIEVEEQQIILRKDEKIIGVFNVDRIQAVFKTK